MAGRAFFYFRDSAWSQAQTEPGFVCDTAEEEEKLSISKSGFDQWLSVAESLPNPQRLLIKSEQISGS